MAGIGPAPKPKSQRRNTTKPARGEWVDLEPLEQPILEPANPRWCAAGRRLWEAVRADPISTQLSSVDIQLLKETMRDWNQLEPAEQRLRMTAFGATPAGRRNLRWRNPAETEIVRKAEAKTAVKRLRVVEEEQAG